MAEGDRAVQPQNHAGIKQGEMDPHVQGSSSHGKAVQRSDRDGRQQQQGVPKSCEMLEQRVSNLQTRLGVYAESLRRSCQCSSQLLGAFAELLHGTPLAQVARSSQEAAEALDENARRFQGELATEATEALHRFSMALPDFRNALAAQRRLSSQARQDGLRQSDVEGRDGSHGALEKAFDELAVDDTKLEREMGAKRMEVS